MHNKVKRGETMKLRTEIVSGAEEEIIIRTPELNEKTERLLRLISSALGSVSELALGYNGGGAFCSHLGAAVFRDGRRQALRTHGGAHVQLLSAAVRAS